MNVIEPASVWGRCAACGTPFEPEEMHCLLPDGTTIHEASQPSSMRRCRDALLATIRELSLKREM